MHHDIVVIGGSAGSVDVLLNLVRDLPADLPAAVFIVTHATATHRALLPELLSARGPLAATLPVHGEKIARSHIYVAPPDNQLELRDGTISVTRGPKENGQRPAVDVLFRSAAASYRSRVIAVVLSGYLDCGAAGMLSVKARGGIGVVQTPESAHVADMPKSVLQRVAVDHVVPPPELPALLLKLVRSTAGEETQPDRSVAQLEGNAPGTPANLVCPTCHGTLAEAHRGGVHSFRCHVGHAFSLRTLLREQADDLERALWAGVRTLEESASLAERLCRSHHGDLRERFGERARTLRSQAAMIQRMLLEDPGLVEADVAELEPT